MEFLSEDATYLILVFGGAAAIFLLALRITQQGKFLIWAFGALGLAALVDVAIVGPARLGAQLRGVYAAVRSEDLNRWVLQLFAAGLPIYAALFGAVATVAVWRGGREWRSLIAWTAWSPRRAGKAYWGLVAGGVVYGMAASVAALTLAWLASS